MNQIKVVMSILAVAASLGVEVWLNEAPGEVVEGKICYKLEKDEGEGARRTEVDVEDNRAGKRKLTLKTKKAFLVCDKALIDLDVLETLQSRGFVETHDEESSSAASNSSGSGSGSGGGGGGGGGTGGGGGSGTGTGGGAGSGGGTSTESGTGTGTGEGTPGVQQQLQDMDELNGSLGGTATWTENSCQVDTTGCTLLPEGAPEQDLVIGDLTGATTQCFFADSSHSYVYHHINVVKGGTLIFKDMGGVVDFRISSLLVEQGGVVEAGTPSCPFGSNGGKLEIGLWGNDPTNPTNEWDKQGLTANTEGIVCKTNGGKCYPDGLDDGNHYCTVKDSDSPCMSTVSDVNGANAIFEKYGDLPFDNPNKLNQPGTFFGYKVLALAYGGTLRFFGKKGVKPAYFTNPPPTERQTSCTLPLDSEQTDPQKWADLTGYSWARLQGTMNATTQPTITVDRTVDWEGGDYLVVGTTDWHTSHSELKMIASGMMANGNTIPLSSKLQYPHHSELLTVADFNLTHPTTNPNLGWNLRASVGFLSRSIKVYSLGQKDNEIFKPAAECGYMGDPGPKPNTATIMTPPDCYFGGHVIVRQGFANFQVQGVEFQQLGQGGRMGHYPAHFHLAKSTDYTNAFVKDSSVWDSMSRFIVLHGTHDVTVARNVGYLSMGHGYYGEDGTEINNLLCHNLGISARASTKEFFEAQDPDAVCMTNPMKCPRSYRAIPPILDRANDSALSNPQEGEARPFGNGGDALMPVTFWFMNAYNEFIGNMAVGAYGYGSGFWLLGSGVSGASKRLSWAGFGPNSEKDKVTNTAEDYANFNRAGARQAPLKSFRGNSVTTATYGLQTTFEVPPTALADSLFTTILNPYPGTNDPDPASDPSPPPAFQRPIVTGNFLPMSFGKTFIPDPDHSGSNNMVSAVDQDDTDCGGLAAIKGPPDFINGIAPGVSLPGGQIRVSGFDNEKNNGLLTVEKAPSGVFCVTNALTTEPAGKTVTVAAQSLLSDVPNCAQGNTKGNEKFFAVNAAHCVATVIDRFTTSFNWPEVNFGSVWLRPQWYLFINSAVTDQLFGGLGFVSGGSWSQNPPGYFTLAQDSIFVGSSRGQKGSSDLFSSQLGPKFTQQECSSQKICRLDKDGSGFFMNNLNPKRMITIYDGPFFADGNLFLKTEAIKCSPGVPLSDPTSCRIYASTIEPAGEGKTVMEIPQAAIGWKQTNAFYYPPAFGFRNSAFDVPGTNPAPVSAGEVCPSGSTLVDTEPRFTCRHNAIDGTRDPARSKYTQGFPGADPNNTKLYAPLIDQFPNAITAIDFSTILNDEDGTFTGWTVCLDPPACTNVSTRTASVSRNPFFDAPSQENECLSVGVVTSPHEFLTTAAAQLFEYQPKDPTPGGLGIESQAWNFDNGTARKLPAVPIYRQLAMKSELDDGPANFFGCPGGTICGGDNNEQWTCSRGAHLVGGQSGQAPYLTANNGVYYVDTDKANQPVTCVNVPGLREISDFWLPGFEGGKSYVIYHLFARPTSKVTYQIYVGSDFNKDDPQQSYWVRLQPHINFAGLDSSVPDSGDSGKKILADGNSMAADRIEDVQLIAKLNNGVQGPVNGVLTVTIDNSHIEEEFLVSSRDENDKCLPRDVCEIAGDGNGCVLSKNLPKELSGLEDQIGTACESWVTELAGIKSLDAPVGVSFSDCPAKGCLGYAFKLPGTFAPKAYAAVINDDNSLVSCFDKSVWDREFMSIDTQCPAPAPDTTNFCS